MAVKGNADIWVPANGGLETPTRYRSGFRLLYVYNPRRKEHGWIDCDRDFLLTESEAVPLIQ